MALAEEEGLDLVEVVPNATPPVCKIMNYGKYRYDQTKREKEGKRAQHLIKVKEVKFRPNISEHDYEFKLKHIREFLDKGFKVKITCTFRGREVSHPEVGERVVRKMCDELADIAAPESPAKLLGRMMSTVLAPGVRKK
jgi:translation initiation factor IF-3